MRYTSILGILLLVSVLGNIGFIAGYLPYEQNQISGLIQKANMLSRENMQLQQQLAAANLSLQGSSCSSNLYRCELARGGFFASSPLGISGTATMLAPAVSQAVENIRNGPFIQQIVVLNGSVMTMTATAQPGQGRVLVETTPLMGIVFQDAANTAVYVAQNRTGVNLNQTDIFFSIRADKQVAAIDGPSAGGLMTLLAIAALEHRSIDPDVTMTGTISMNGHIGAIGGALDKARAAKNAGITHFLIPRENQQLTIYDQQVTNYRGIQLVDYVPRTVEAKTYIEQNAGITVDYVNTIDDVLKIALV